MIDNWHGKPIGELSRGELIDALDWCIQQLRKDATVPICVSCGKPAIGDCDRTSLHHNT